MTCTECGDVIPFVEEDVTVRVVYNDGRGMEARCHHNPFDETDPAIVAILGSRKCADTWIYKQAAMLN